MGEVKPSETCKVVAVRYRFVVEQGNSTDAVIVRFVPESCQNRDEEVRLAETESLESKPDGDDAFEDDVAFLRSLDPKEWKKQDHYAVLGLRTLRHRATDDDIKRAYRRKVLKHHPDKRKAQGEEIRPDDDYFTCITKAYEILGTPMKRRSYDSVDPEFDDSLPSGTDLKRDFFEVFAPYFELNARWSEKKNVPGIGNMDSSREEVEMFYSFWYDFDSWREFSYLDEEEKEKGQDRDERRWILKQNKAARAKRKKEEMARIRSLVDLAYNADPRILKFKQEDKDRKLAAKRAKQDAAQARKEEEERAVREAKIAQEKAEAAERARIEAKRQEREAQKKTLKKERKTFRDLCKSNNYYCASHDEQLSHMAAIEKICEVLKLEEIEEVNKNLKTGGRETFLKVMHETEQRLEAERKALYENQASKPTNSVKSVVKNGTAEWTPDHIQLLVKAVNLFPAGTNQRWEVVATFINQHGEFPDESRYNAKEVLAKAKDLQNADFSKSNLKVAANKQAFDNFEKEKRAVKVVDNAEISTKEETETNHISESSKKAENSVKSEAPWTPTEQQLLEQALKTYPASTAERWDRIAECIPNRTKKDCMKRYKELVEIVKAKKAAQASVKPK